MPAILILLFSIIILIGIPAQATDKSKKQKELTQLQNKIGKLKKTIEVKENSRSSYNRQLKEIEKQIGSLSKDIRDSNRSISQQQSALNKLNRNKKAIQTSIKKHHKDISRQMFAAYTLGDQEQIKLLFSQQNAATLQRNLTFYNYYANHRIKQIDLAEQDFALLLENEQQIKQAKVDLEIVLKKQRLQKKDLDTDRSKRSKIVQQLEQELKKQGNFLSLLEENAQNLKQLINSLSEIMTESQSEQKSDTKFARLKGKLSWPVKGQVKKLFGHPKPPSNLRWQGVIINAPEGNNVRAISHGRIAFSDWLRGMGNLIIIDHGDGYLSLYGHNESLFKEAGEWVEAGDIIGSIGNSGGQKQSGLYFEIRKKGKPSNPSSWCHVRNWFAV
mgnify:FL=1